MLSVGRLLEDLDEKEKQTNPHPTPKHIPIHTPIPVVNKHTRTGITYGGGGKPMDLGKMREENCCFRCGEKGHFGRDCPNKKKVNICALLTELDDEERAELKGKLEEETKEDLDTKDEDFVDSR